MDKNLENLNNEIPKRILRKRRNSSRQKIMILFGVLFFLSGFCGFVFGLFTPTKNISDLLTPNFMAQPAKGELNLVLFGIDDVDETHRTDTILWLNINTNDKTITMMSVPRDTLVQIPGHGYDKINAAYAYGNTELALRTLTNFIGVKPDKYVILGYKGFMKIIDAIGGVDINVDKRMYYVDNWAHFTIDLYPGMQHLNGLQSLEYVRFRHDALGDFGRMRRQQEFLLAVKNQLFSSPAMITKIPDILKVVLDNVQTDMSFNDALSWALAVKDIVNQPNFQIKRIFLDEGMVPKYAYGVDYLWPTQKVVSIIKSVFPNANPDVPLTFPFPEDKATYNSVNTVLQKATQNQTTNEAQNKTTTKNGTKTNVNNAKSTVNENQKIPSPNNNTITLPQR
ncbi:cell envelope-related transcriptional attenuator [Thermodesulfobium narugense DSM 14796]|uniref:Cell envelope-related transcriptional attenuator n=1 Tax=Thermodesulfobium narugense DSM 14796 TaxID=747365 RepID=M1E744_9BACT|nr:LCP family protein [Thermodesulfobium narugense]AEE14310.1 cell envelope-related transcriptional attenuator [Thermodesulfobium narugense DSM 14796]